MLPVPQMPRTASLFDVLYYSLSIMKSWWKFRKCSFSPLPHNPVKNIPCTQATEKGQEMKLQQKTQRQ